MSAMAPARYTRVVPLLPMTQVRQRRGARVEQRRLPGVTRITSKNQATIPVSALREAGLKPGDRVKIDASGSGQLRITRAVDPIAKYAGALTGVYPKGYLRKLRSEWRW